jgi:hypothetical protein
MRVRLAHSNSASGATTAAFRLHYRTRVKLRAVINDAAASPDYVRSWSNFVVSR